MPSPPSRLPSVEDTSSLGISIRTGCSRSYPEDCISGCGSGNKFLDLVTKLGRSAGKPFEKKVGINPFTAGSKFGEKVVAPALFKVIPPYKGYNAKKGKGVHMLGGQRGMRK